MQWTMRPNPYMSCMSGAMTLAMRIGQGHTMCRERKSLILIPEYLHSTGAMENRVPSRLESLVSELLVRIRLR